MHPSLLGIGSLSSVREMVGATLIDLDSVQVHISGQSDIPLMSRFRSLARTGKAVRIDRNRLGLPKQSVYDHVNTLGSMADSVGHMAGVQEEQKVLLADCIAFHDLAEVLIGDIPTFTNPELASAYLSGRIVEGESEANSLIAASLPPELAGKFSHALAILSEDQNPVVPIFHMLDKMEPILSVWRYIRLFHDKIAIDAFLRSMEDFFISPKTKGYGINQEFVRTILFFQEPDNARKYYYDGIESVVSAGLDSPAYRLAMNVIEPLPMHFIEDN